MRKTHFIFMLALMASIFSCQKDADLATNPTISDSERILNTVSQEKFDFTKYLSINRTDILSRASTFCNDCQTCIVPFAFDGNRIAFAEFKGKVKLILYPKAVGTHKLYLRANDRNYDVTVYFADPVRLSEGIYVPLRIPYTDIADKTDGKYLTLSLDRNSYAATTLSVKMEKLPLVIELSPSNNETPRLIDESDGFFIATLQ